METRKFWLINSIGNKYDLSDINAKFSMVSPQGLGFEKELVTEKIGGREKVTSESILNIDVTGEIWFYNSTKSQMYENYDQFIDFIKYKPLELHYLPPNRISDYYADVIITKLDKSEIEGNKLSCPITFHKLTQWLDGEEFTISVTNNLLETGKSYPLVRPYHYAGNSLNNILYTNRGTEACGFIFEIDGHVVNPQLTVYDSTNTITGRIKLDGTFDHVMIDSNEDAYSMELIRNGVNLSNPENYQDLSIGDGVVDLTWVKLAVGVNNRAVFNCNNLETFDGTVYFKYRNAFASI